MHKFAHHCIVLHNDAIVVMEERAVSERIVLAYSGGLDTSVAIGWIAEATGSEVIAVAVDVGQGGMPHGRASSRPDASESPSWTQVFRVARKKSSCPSLRLYSPYLARMLETRLLFQLLDGTVCTPIPATINYTTRISCCGQFTLSTTHLITRGRILSRSR